MPGIDFDQVRAHVSLRDVLTLLEFHPVRGDGSQLRGLCPWRCSPSGRTFVAYLESDRYHCFSCRRSGNQLDLWAAVGGLSIHEAAQDLCHRLRIEVPILSRWQPRHAP